MIKIVAVDDNPILQQLLNLTFTHDAKLHGMVFSNGNDAIDFVRHHSVDLFILDWNMPDYSGKQLLEHLRMIARFERTPIIILSGDEEVDLKLEAKYMGATGWIVKPFNPAKLRMLIYKLVGMYCSSITLKDPENHHLF